MLRNSRLLIRPHQTAPTGEPSSKKARLILTTDELVVNDDNEIDDTEDFDDSDYLDEKEYEAEEADH